MKPLEMLLVAILFAVLHVTGGKLYLLGVVVFFSLWAWSSVRQFALLQTVKRQSLESPAPPEGEPGNRE